jgi:guanosine-3',5'-bis(diphosphate) 3'-pyrophosphohydrolase
MISDIEYRAREFAYAAHAGQKRKYTQEDYIVHPAAVSEIVRSVPHTAQMICAAWLHDTVEDCGVTLMEIQELFGEAVSSYVKMLTDISKPTDGNREVRKAIDREHIRHAMPQAKTVKLADLIDNSRSILKYDPDFAVIYMREKKLLLPNLEDGNQVLFGRASEIVDYYYNCVVGRWTGNPPEDIVT